MLYSDIYSESIEIHGDTEIHINIFREVLHPNIFSDGGYPSKSLNDDTDGI